MTTTKQSTVIMATWCLDLRNPDQGYVAPQTSFLQQDYPGPTEYEKGVLFSVGPQSVTFITDCQSDYRNTIQEEMICKEHVMRLYMFKEEAGTCLAGPRNNHI